VKHIIKKIKIGSDFKELLSHSTNYISAEFFSKGLALLTIPIFTRLMAPDEYGVMSIFASFVGLFTVIYGLGIRGAIGRYYYEDEDDFFGFFSSNFWLIVCCGVLFSMVFLFLRNHIQRFFNIPIGMIYLGLATVLFGVIFQLYQGYLQASKQSKKISILTVVQSVVGTVGAIVIMLYLKEERYYGKAIAQLVASGLMVIVSFYYLKKYIYFDINVKHIKYSLTFGIPIVFHLLSQNLLNTFDQIIINQTIGQEATGLYSLAYRIGMIQILISMGILKAWTPMFYEKMKLGQYNQIESLAKKYGIIVAFIACSLILFSKDIIFVFADKSYFEALPVIPIVVVGYYFFFLYTIYVNYTFYQKKTSLIAIFTLVAGCINVGLNYWLIPIYGYIVAAWTTLFSYFILFLLHYVNVKWIIKSNTPVNFKVFIKPLILVGTCYIANYYLAHIEFNYLIILFVRILLIMIFTALFFFKKLFKGIK